MPGSPEQTRATLRPLGGAGERKAAALDLGTERELVARLAGGGGADQVEIEAVADQLLGLGQQALRLARAPAQVARPEADDGEPALGAADGAGIEVVRRQGDGAGDPLALALGHQEAAFRTDCREGGAFGDTPAAGLAEDDLGGRCEASGLGEQALGAKKRAGTPSVAASACTAGSAALRSRETMQPMLARASPCSARTASTRSDSASDGAPASVPTPRARRVDGRRAGRVSLDGAVRDQQLRGCLGVDRQVCAREPRWIAGIDGQPDRAALEQPSHDALGVPGLARVQPGGGASRARPKRLSPAVVTAGATPRSAAIFRASSLAP